LFLPTTRSEMDLLGWDALDVIIVTGDAYIDSPYIGTSMIGKVLLDAGYRVGIIGQPDFDSPDDITRLGEPRLFWGVSGGCVDSLVANYTATRKPRQNDDFTPGGVNDKRPSRAVIVYSNLIRRYFKNTAPVVLGGAEASLRRISHYDYWSDSVRRSILFDAKADLLVYGMGERAVLELAAALSSGDDWRQIRGICHVTSQAPPDHLELPSHDQVVASGKAFTEMYRLFYDNNEPLTARPLKQRHENRWLVQNLPAEYLSQKELDHFGELDFERDLHPYHLADGDVRSLDTIRFSLPALRGCYGECSFCSIAVHQGRTVRWRSEASLLREARTIIARPDFKGYLLDVGGPTANMYGFECTKKLAKGPCLHKRCLYPETCPTLKTDHSPQLKLLKKLRQLPGVKKVFVASGIRHDMVLGDKKHGDNYINQLAQHHVSGQLKLAPEHCVDRVLDVMGKPGVDSLLEFRKRFLKANERAGKKQFLTYYLIAAHPGCGEREMRELKNFTYGELKLNPEQVQVFTPLPSSWSAVMYHTGINPFTGREIFVERDLTKKQKQKDIITKKRRRGGTVKGRSGRKRGGRD
jgi:uncharacterized radical SAM protein YgiQ